MKAQRKLCLMSLIDELTPLCDSPSTCLSEAVELEHSAYIYAERCPIAYPFAILRVIELLKEPKFIDLRGIDHSGKLRFNYLQLLYHPSRELHASLPCQEEHLHTEQLRQDNDNLLRDLSSTDCSHVPNAGTRCAKCNSSDIAFDFLQTRSADEGTTVYCTCTACGKRWKM